METVLVKLADRRCPVKGESLWARFDFGYRSTDFRLQIQPEA